MPTEPTAGFSARRRWSGWVNLFLGVAAMLALAAMANYLSHRHYSRWQWAKRLDSRLSQLTQLTLAEISKPVTVVIFYDRRESLYRPILELLRRYGELAPSLHIETVDYELEPARATQIQNRYKLPPNVHDLVLFHSNERTEVVPHSALSQVSPTGQTPDGRIVFERTHFNGERLFTSALAAVSDTNRHRAYFLAGRGTHSFTNTTSWDGYGSLGQRLRQMNLDLQPATLSATQPVPKDCRLLIVAGPRTELDAQEIQRLREYLSAGGRLWMLFHRATRAGLEHLMAEQGVLVGDDLVNDPGNGFGDGSIKFSAFADPQHGIHPAVRALAAQDVSLRLGAPRSISPLPGRAPVKCTQLIATSAQGLAYRQPAPGATNAVLTVDRRGAISVGVAAEKAAPGQDAHLAPRLLVLGDSDCFNNTLLDKEGNSDLAWNMSNWLLDRSHLLAIGPRPIQRHVFSTTERERWELMGWLLGIIPAGILAVGSLVWLRRRH